VPVPGKLPSRSKAEGNTCGGPEPHLAAPAGPPGQPPVGGGFTVLVDRWRSVLIEGREADRAVRAVVLTLLAVDGVLCALASAFLLPLYIGRVPFPISALIAGVVNLYLVWAAMQWTTSMRLAAIPLLSWLAAVGTLTFGGPGGDIIFAGTGLHGLRVVLFIAVGAGPAAWLLWRRNKPSVSTLR
jgi:hypothetical protein